MDEELRRDRKLTKSSYRDTKLTKSSICNTKLTEDDSYSCLSHQ